MRYRSVLVVLALIGVLAPSGPARAGDEVHCVNTHDVAISPGVSLQGSAGSIDVTPVPTMECDGPVDGRMPTGAGWYGEETGRYGTEDPDSCQAGGEGDGVFFATIPTSEGDLELRAPYNYTFGDMTTNPGYVSGEFRGDGVRGVFKLVPVEGDCVSSPITRVRVNAEFWFAPSFFRR
ncbi:MAG: hypothetical protein ACRDZ7_21555 [Acidimicrobiia bacterium]